VAGVLVRAILRLRAERARDAAIEARRLDRGEYVVTVNVSAGGNRLDDQFEFVASVGRRL
jgi:hypothetical protein